MGSPCSRFEKKCGSVAFKSVRAHVWVHLRTSICAHLRSCKRTCACVCAYAHLKEALVPRVRAGLGPSCSMLMFVYERFEDSLIHERFCRRLLQLCADVGLAYIAKGVFFPETVPACNVNVTQACCSCIGTILSQGRASGWGSYMTLQADAERSYPSIPLTSASIESQCTTSVRPPGFMLDIASG